MRIFPAIFLVFAVLVLCGRPVHAAPTVTGPGKLYVLAVGVNDYYDSRLALNFAVPDAQAIIYALTRAGNGLYSEVVTTLVTDTDVTAEGLEAAFSEIGAETGPQDTFVLFMAGRDKAVDGRYYYLPQDFRYRDASSFAAEGIGQDRLQEWLSKIQALRRVLLFDFFESGSLTGGRIEAGNVERPVETVKKTAAMGRTTKTITVSTDTAPTLEAAMGRATIVASTDTASALEGYNGHGVFAYAILKGLDAADGNKDGDVGVLEMIGYLDYAVPELSDEAFKRRQIPQVAFSGDNFVFAKRVAFQPTDSGAATRPASLLVAPKHVVIAPTEREGPDSGTTVTHAMAARKVALIIGNAAYRGSHVPQLNNPLNDVFVMRQALEAADFEVYSFTDLTRSGMSHALDEFEAASSDADIGVVYYSGHGMEIAGKNFLVPIDAVLASERDAKYEAIELGDVLAALAHVKLLKLVLLDACRDNPQLEKMRVANRSIGGASKGLARIDDIVEGNLLIAYATAPGETATDGMGVNSPFASALADHLVEPGVEVEAALRSVARDVYRSTGGKQRPYKTGSIFEAVSLGRNLPKAEPNLDVDKCRDAAAHWTEIKSLDDAAHYEDHLRMFGTCPFASLAKSALLRLKSITDKPGQ